MIKPQKTLFKFLAEVSTTIAALPLPSPLPSEFFTIEDNNVIRSAMNVLRYSKK
jgi:hypothetical protein